MKTDVRFRLKSGSKTHGEVLLYGDVGFSWFDGITAKAFADQLKGLGDINSLDVRINSYGGDVFDGLAIYSQLMAHKARVVTFVDGIAASIASVIAMAGEEIHMAEAGSMMIHDAWGVAIGNATDMRDMAARLETVTASLADVYVSRTGKKSDEVRGWMTAETWFNSTDALKNGFATKIIENMKAVAKYDPARYRFKNAPPQLTGRPDFEAAAIRVQEQRARLARLSLKRA